MDTWLVLLENMETNQVFSLHVGCSDHHDAQKIALEQAFRTLGWRRTRAAVPMPIAVEDALEQQ